VITNSGISRLNQTFTLAIAFSANQTFAPNSQYELAESALPSFDIGYWAASSFVQNASPTAMLPEGSILNNPANVSTPLNYFQRLWTYPSIEHNVTYLLTLSLDNGSTLLWLNHSLTPVGKVYYPLSSPGDSITVDKGMFDYIRQVSLWNVSLTSSEVGYVFSNLTGSRNGSSYVSTGVAPRGYPSAGILGHRSGTGFIATRRVQTHWNPISSSWGVTVSHPSFKLGPGRTLPTNLATGQLLANVRPAFVWSRSQLQCLVFSPFVLREHPRGAHKSDKIPGRALL
jgi:hypothetical protein